MFVDPSGLNEEDVKKILSDIEKNRGLEAPGYRFEDLSGKGVGAQYDYWDNMIVLDNSVKCAQLDEGSFVNLYASLYHETRHHNERWYHRSVDVFIEFFKSVGPYHQDIYKDASDLRLGVDGYYDQIMELYNE
jgi:hypothetical protein